MENGTIIAPIHITGKEAAKSTKKKKTMSDVGVQMMEAPSVLTNRNSAINKKTLMYVRPSKLHKTLKWVQIFEKGQQ
jgi:hypothetical protein